MVRLVACAGLMVDKKKMNDGPQSGRRNRRENSSAFSTAVMNFNDMSSSFVGCTACSYCCSSLNLGKMGCRSGIIWMVELLVQYKFSFALKGELCGEGDYEGYVPLLPPKISMVDPLVQHKFSFALKGKLCGKGDGGISSPLPPEN